MADAGLRPGDVDGMLSYHGNDSTTSQALAQDLGHPARLLHGLLRRGLEHRGLVGLASGAIEAGYVPHGGHLPVHERLLRGPAWAARRRRAGRPARVVAGAGLETVPYGLSSPAQNVPVHLRPPHARLRDDQRAAGPRQGGAQPATPPTTRRPTTRRGSRSTTCSTPAGSSSPPATCSTAASRPTTPPASSSRRPTGPGISASGRSTSCRWPAGSTSRSRACALPVRSRSPGRPGTTPNGSCSAMPASSRRTSR